MLLLRSIVARAALFLLAALSVANPAHAQAWPAKPVRLIVPVVPGAAPDVVARLLAERLGERWGQTLVVDNRPGAGGIPGMSALARSAADGYTLGLVPAAMATVTPLVYENPQFDPDTDLKPVATVGTSPLMLVTRAGSGIETLADLARHAQAHPGAVNFAAAQPNSLPHLAGELVSRVGRMGLYTVPYPGPPAAVTAVIAGDAALTVDGLPGVLPHVKSGRLKALAVTSAQRLRGFEQVPTVAETYPGYELVGWFQVFAPAGTPAAVVDRVNADVNALLQSDALVARLAELGVYPRAESVPAAAAFYAGQRKAMKQLVAELGLGVPPPAPGASKGRVP